MSKRKKEKAQRRDKEVADLLDLQEDLLRQIDKKFPDIKSLADPVKKILKLHELQSDISEAYVKVILERENIIYRRTYDATHGLRAWRLFTPLGTFNKEQEIRSQIFFQNIGPRDFLNSQTARASRMLAETLKTCDLKEVANSALFSDVSSFKKFLDEHVPLRDRFEVAAFKAAVSAVKQSPPVPPSAKSGVQPPQV